MICRHMHWDYYTYKAQPQEFKDTIINHMNAEGMAAKKGKKTTPPSRDEFLASIEPDNDD